MILNFEGEISVDFANTYTNALDLSTPSDVLSLSKTWTFANGKADDEAESQWHDQRTLAGSAVDSIDLYGALTDAFGQTLNFTKIKALYIENLSASDILRVGGGSNALVNWIQTSGDQVNIGPGGAMLLVCPKTAGYAVTAGTADILTITNTGTGSNSYKIVVIGTLA